MSLARIRNISLTSNSSHTYRGRRQNSYRPLDTVEQVELRARMRTFDQAYLRTALTNLGYSVVILKLFDKRFTHSKCLLLRSQVWITSSLIWTVGLLFAASAGNNLSLHSNNVLYQTYFCFSYTICTGTRPKATFQARLLRSSLPKQRSLFNHFRLFQLQENTRETVQNLRSHRLIHVSARCCHAYRPLRASIRIMR
jgi:hypothetical protein